MKHLATILLLFLFVALGVSLACDAGAAQFPPLVGTYKTLLGTILPGRAVESMPCDLCEGVIGNLVMADSWNGVALGTNWTVSCPQIASSPVLVYEGVVGGNGQRIYQTAYGGGSLWLSGVGAWGGGDPFYAGNLTAFTVIATKQYVGGQLVGVVSNINLTGTFDGFTNCFTRAISNAEFVGATRGAPMQPGPFPAFLGPSDCAQSGAHGTYWDVHDVTLSILGACQTPVRKSTWGLVKTLYR